MKSRLLPDPFLFADGRRVDSPATWAERRHELRRLVVDEQYGVFPPVPDTTTFETLHTAEVRRLGGARSQTWRILTGPEPRFSFLLNVLVPPGDGPFPVLLNGDGCWRYLTGEVEAEGMKRGMILAQFNRVEIVPDMATTGRTSGLYPLYPAHDFRALAAWAWGYHRAADALLQSELVDPRRIAITGHSRGGKTTLLAGATDERIAVVCANNSGSGGAGCYRWQGEGSETLPDILGKFPYWFAPGLSGYVGREREMPFDQHYLKALIAPRPLLTTEAFGDTWANPTGTWQSHRAAREVYRWLGAEDRLGILYREGGHEHSLADWCASLDFASQHFSGQVPDPGFRQDYFPELPSPIDWQAPVRSAKDHA